MDLGLVGYRALISGGGRGIGLAIAQALTAESADVVICGRDPASLAEFRPANGTGRHHNI